MFPQIFNKFSHIFTNKEIQKWTSFIVKFSSLLWIFFEVHKFIQCLYNNLYNVLLNYTIQYSLYCINFIRSLQHFTCCMLQHDTRHDTWHDTLYISSKKVIFKMFGLYDGGIPKVHLKIITGQNLSYFHNSLQRTLYIFNQR